MDYKGFVRFLKNDFETSNNKYPTIKFLDQILFWYSFGFGYLIKCIIKKNLI